MTITPEHKKENRSCSVTLSQNQKDLGDKVKLVIVYNKKKKYELKKARLFKVVELARGARSIVTCGQ